MIKTPKVSIGLYVYNGEKFLQKRLEGILSQTFSDFELILSDNASTDSTPKICEEFAKKDERIKYIRQEKNMGLQWNANFVLNQARTPYFMWAQVDDINLPEFIEKNIVILESKKNAVGSICKVELYGPITHMLKSNLDDSFFMKCYKKTRNSFRHMNTKPLLGSYEKRIRTYLKNPGHNNILFSLFRTEELRKCIVNAVFAGDDFALVLNVLRYGEIEVVNEIMMYKFEGGMSGKGMISLANDLNWNFLGILFPLYPFTCWCLKHLGIKLFLKNVDCFIMLNLGAEFALVLDIIRRVMHKASS